MPEIILAYRLTLYQPPTNLGAPPVGNQGIWVGEKQKILTKNPEKNMQNHIILIYIVPSYSRSFWKILQKIIWKFFVNSPPLVNLCKFPTSHFLLNLYIQVSSNVFWMKNTLNIVGNHIITLYQPPTNLGGSPVGNWRFWVVGKQWILTKNPEKNHAKPHNFDIILDPPISGGVGGLAIPHVT